MATDQESRLIENQRLMTFAQPMLEGLYRQIARNSATVLLADRYGTILTSIGNADFLAPRSNGPAHGGFSWREASTHANAVGTALTTNSAIPAHGDLYLFAHNRALACITAPILAPAGGMLGVLDIAAGARDRLSHLRAMLRTTAELIEQRLIESLDRQFLTLHFDARIEGLTDPFHAMMAFDESGLVMVSNRRGRALLRLRDALGPARYGSCFATPWDDLTHWAQRTPDTPFPIRSCGGRSYFARARLHRRDTFRRTPTTSPTPTPLSDGHSQLGALALGDPQIDAIVRALREVAEVRTPLLVSGEMGTGKAFLTRAFHADHAASPDAPAVALDCSTLPAGELGEELLDEAWLRAANGILFLDEFATLPSAVQSRLFEPNDGTRARVVGALRHNPASLEAAGQLDLTTFHANGGRIITLPPLRQRSDFESLVRQFISELAPGRRLRVGIDALTLLRYHPWPGNVRELRNVLRLALALLDEHAGELHASDIPVELFDRPIEAR